ncbi:CWC15 [Acrasis kona]|uniref:CWC15 n=1 Tax=Acrasis kona TaxID=1008807 RepID=A0AAW2ZEL5_9EUKA
MSNAHRPTFKPALATENQGGYKRWVPSRMQSAKDLPSNMSLKTRQIGQNTREEIKDRDFKQELKDREREARIKSGKHVEEEKPIAAIEQSSEETKQYDDSDDVLAGSDDEKDQDDDENEDDDDDDDDDDEELMKELAKIRKERQVEQLRKEQEEQEFSDKKRLDDALNSNPLMQPEFSDTASDVSSSFSIKRKWNDDVVFKNQARDEPKTKKRFINDTIRNDFHRKFLDKYMK